MELSKKIYGNQFTTVTTHKNVQNYYNEKCAKYLMFDLKKYRGVSFMRMKSDAKFEEKLTYDFENDMRNMTKLKRDTKFGEESTDRFKIGIRNLTKFDPSTQKPRKFSFSWTSIEQSIYTV